MGQTIRRIRTHRRSKELINSFYDNNSHSLIIHYSCESFYNIKDGKTPRVTSIAVRFLNTTQTKSFSIHKVAELKKINKINIPENYDMLEKEMLKDFYDFVKEHPTYRWIHWSMRDINYGFEALKHRANILGTKPFDIADDNKFDLARLLLDRYGEHYANHPRMGSILDMNKISSKHWLSGDEEAKAFEDREFVKLHQSTLAKVDVIEDILKRSAENSLKTKSRLIDIYGLYPQGLFELAKDNWIYSLILIILTTLIGIGITKLIE